MRYKLLGENRSTVEQIFSNRGLDTGLLLKSNDPSVVHDPFLLDNMEEAIDLVKKHIDQDSLIYVQQDPDADGLTSTALFILYLKSIYPDMRYEVGIHEGKQHGFDMKRIKELIDSGKKPDIVVSPDASSNEHDKHLKLKNMGIDVLVLDHHEADRYSKSALVVNPQLDNYPNKNISGVGVVQKFARAFDMKYRRGDTTLSDSHYDLVAVGLVADMIEITTPEAVYMTQQGMSNINNTFLEAMYERQSYSMGNKVTPMGIAFYIAPLINAVTRTATMEEKELVLRAMLETARVEVPSTKRGNKPGDKEVLQEQAVRIMTNIRSRQRRMVDRAVETVEKKIEEQELEDDQLLIIDVNHKFERELTGLIANKIVSERQKPVLIGSQSKCGTELLGSGRTYDKSSLPDLRGFLNESGIVEFAEGHGAAHGFGVKLDRVSELTNYANKELSDMDFTPQHEVDFIWEEKDIDIPFLEELIRLESFWARGIEEPYFMIKGLRVPKSAVSLTGTFDLKTFKIELDKFSIIQFRVPVNKVQPFIHNASTTIDLIGRVSLNEFRGKKTIQVFMEDFEVKESKKFYF